MLCAEMRVHRIPSSRYSNEQSQTVKGIDGVIPGSSCRAARFQGCLPANRYRCLKRRTEVETDQERAERYERERKEDHERHERERKEAAEKAERERAEQHDQHARKRAERSDDQAE